MIITEDINEFFRVQCAPTLYKRILFITNDRDPESNKTLKNFKEALEDSETELTVLVAEEMTLRVKDDVTILKDSENEFALDSDDNSDTLVVTRLGAQGSEDCERALDAIEDEGLLVLNPLKAAKRASNKYATSVLLEQAGIPQPRYSVLSRRDIENPELLAKACGKIYDKWGDDPETDNGKEFVVKILDGHGGTGVFLVNGKNMLAILQAFFAVSPESRLLMQRKEEADGGDIRVHVLTTSREQKILASMKRVKISGDFRSNVSLGAKAEKVELTKEQEGLALKAAKVSGLPWCAVDIMPLKKDTNVDGYDNVILEFNASPGTDGISEVIGENFVNVLLDALDEAENVLPVITAGFREGVKIKIEDEYDEFLAKLDTGNGAKASTLSVDTLALSADGKQVTFQVKGREYTKDVIEEADVRVGKVLQHRVVVEFPEMRLGKRTLRNVKFAIDEDRDKSTDALINRDLLRKMSIVVSPAVTHLLTDKMKINKKE